MMYSSIKKRRDSSALVGSGIGYMVYKCIVWRDALSPDWPCYLNSDEKLPPRMAQWGQGYVRYSKT
jgi:hypothetical protein